MDQEMVMYGNPSVHYQWVEVIPVPPIDNPPCPLWQVKIKHPDWLDGGRTWIESVDFHNLHRACLAAHQINEAFQRFWKVKLELADANREIFSVAMAMSDTNKPYITYRVERDKINDGS